MSKADELYYQYRRKLNQENHTKQGYRREKSTGQGIRNERYIDEALGGRGESVQQSQAPASAPKTREQILQEYRGGITKTAQPSGIKNRTNAFLMNAAERLQNQAPAYRPPEANEMTKRLAAEYLRADSPSIGSPDAGFRNTTAGETAAVMKQADQRRQEQQKERQRQEFVNALRNPNARIGGAIRPDVTGSQGNVDQYGRAVSPLAQRAEEEYFSKNPIDRAAYMVTAAADPDNPLNDKRKIVAQNYATMTNEEKGVYNYLYATRGPSAAEEYHNGLMDVINQRRGQEYYEQNLQDSSPIIKTAYSFGSGFGSGLEGVANLPNAVLGVENRRARSPMEYTSGAIRSDENNSFPEQMAYDIASSTGNMAPGMIASALTGAPMLGSAVFAASAGGNAYAEALANGESVNTSQMYAAQQFVDEEVTNWLLGGINAFGGGALRNLLANSPAGQAVSEAVDNVVKSETGRRLVKSLLSYLGDMAGEAQQEYLQFFTENFTKALLGMKDENGNPTQLNTNLLDPDALYAAALGALNAGLLNVPSGAARINQGVRADVSGVADFAQELAETPREAYTTDAAYESAQELQKLAEEIGQKKNVTAADRLAYNEAMNEFMQTAQEADAEENVEGQIEAEERAALNEEAVKELSRGFGEEGARAFQDMAPDHAVNSYRDFTAYYNHIRFGTEVPADTRATLTAEQISAAMKAGAADANAAFPQEKVRTANKAVNRVNLENVKAGNVDTSGINYNSLTEGQKLRVDYAGALVSKAFGMDVRFVQSKAENGAYKGMNGSFQVINGRPTITLDVNAGMNLESDWTGELTDVKKMFPVIAHEITHSLEKSNPALYKQLSNAVIQALSGNENYTEGGTINEIIRAERNRMDRMELDADGNRIQHTDSDAIHEIVARACEDFLSGDERAVKVFENVDAETKQTLWDHVKEVFDNIKEFFTQMLKNYKSDSDEAKAIRQNMEEYERIRGIWQRALNGEEGEMLTAFGDESGEVVRGESGNPVIVENKDGSGVVYSLKTMSDTQAKLAKYLRSKGYSESDVIAATGMVENYADMLIGIASNYAKMQETLNAELTLDVKNGRSVLHSFVTNGEYPVNVDFLTVCKKRVAYMHVLNDLIDDGIFNDVAFQGKAIAAVNEILREKGYETACLGCFVEARRLQIQTWAETICSEWNALVLEKNPDATPFNFGENTNANRLTPDEIVQMTKELSSGGKKNTQGLLNLGTGAVALRMGRLLDKVPTLAHTLSVGDLIKPNGISKLKAHSGELYSLVKSRYGTNSPKIAQNFNPYNSEILDLKYAFMKSDIGKAIPDASIYKKGINRDEVIRDLKARHADDSSYNPTKAEINAEIEERAIQAYLYDNAGVRLQSFSDFMIENTLDYFQLYADLSAKKLPLHAYSKEIVFMKLFGMTGGKGNMSLISTIDDATVAKYGQEYAGLKENPDGTFSYAGWGDYAHHIEMNGQTFIQSIGWKDAIALMLDPRYSAHNGTIAIGISKMQIQKMLDDPLIRMIIPYHASGINPEFADKVGIAAYHNYEPVQTTRIGKIVSSIDGNDHSSVLGKDISKLKLGDSFSFNKEMQKAKYKGDARSVCDAYLEWCAKEHTLYSGGKPVAKVTLTPKFEEFADHRNYYKLIEDFNMYDCITEAPAPQGAVTMTFRDENHMLTEQQLKEYEDRLRKTGEFTEEDIRKYVAQAQMTMQEIIAQEVKNRKAYNEKQDAVYDETLKEIKDELHKPEYSRETTRPQNSMRDSEYMSAVESDDTDTADRLVEEAAKEAGYTVRAYHGTPTGGFTKFVTDNVINGREFGDGIYFSSSREAAQNFTAATGRTKGTINPMVYDTYLNLGDNVLTIDYDELRKQYKGRTALINYEVKDMIKKQGPDASAIVIKGVYDGSDIKATNYIVKASSQAKSAETVVYDDDGNVIPLSERFNSGNDDIRYSQRGVDMSEELAAGREQMDERYLARMADVIAEKDAEIEKLKAKMDKAVGAEKEKAKERLEKLRKEKNDRIAYLEKSYKANLDWRIAEMRQRMDQMKNASAEEKQKARERLNKLRAQKDQKIEDILQKNREQRLKRREKKAMQELLRRARRLMGESRKGSPEFKAQVDALIGDLDLAAAGLRDNTRAKLEELRKQVEAQSKLDPDYAKYEAPKYAELLNRIDPSKRHIKDMSIDEITRLTEAIVALEHSKQTADREIREGHGRLFGHYGKLAVEQQKMAKGINYKNEIGAQLGKYRLNMLNPVRGFALIDGYQKDGVFTYFGKQLNDGQTKAAQFRMEVEKMFHDIDQNKNLIDDFAKQNIEIETLEGTKKISKGMRIALYMHLQNLDNVKHIAFGGITIPNETLYKRGKYKEAYAAGETVHLSEWIPGALGENVLSEANRKNDAMAAAAIRKITDQMTPEEKEYAKIAQEFFNVKTKNAINEVSLELNGYEKATVDDYFPICTDKNYLASNYDGLVQNGTLEGVGFLKERIGSRLPIYLEDVSQVVLRQKNNTALYYGLAIPVRNFSKFYRYTGGERLERTVKKAVGNTWHQPGLDYIDHVLNDLQFGRQTQRTITDSLKSLYAGTTLNFNIGVSIKQSASYPFAASVIGWEPLIKAARHVVSKADREYMDSITPWGYMRRTGFSGTEMGEVAKQRTGIDNNRTIQKAKSALDLIRRVDVKTTEVLFFACEEYVKENYPDLEVRGREYNKKLAEVYNETLQRTQPSYDVMQRNEFLRSQNDIAKIFGAFKTQTFNMGGEVLDAWGRWRAYSEYAKTDSSYKKAAKDAGKAFGNTVAATIAAQGMLVILTAAANAVLHKMRDYRDDKGEVTPESVAAKILKDFGTSFAGLTMGGSEVQDFALALLGDGKWYDIDYPGLALMNDFASASVDFKNAITKAIDTGDKKDMQKASVKMAKLLMQMFKLKGVPTQNIYNIANAIYLWGTDIKNGEAGTFNAGEGLFGLQDTSPTKQQYAKQAVDAYKRGDIAKGDRAVSRTSKDALKKAMGNGKGTQEDAIMFFQETDLTDEVQRRLWEAAGWKIKNYEKIFHK